MSTKYKFHNPSGVYFISFAVIHWMDIFVRVEYMNEIVGSLKYCQQNKGLILYAWVIMPSHLHLIFRAENENPGQLIGDFKKFTSKKLVKFIVENPRESRKKWLMRAFKRAGQANSNIFNYQFGQQDNHSIELWSREVAEQKLNYLHQNPMVSGFVNEPQDWLFSSAIDYAGGKGYLKVQFLI